MVDEAHERSISTDILLGLLKKVFNRVIGIIWCLHFHYFRSIFLFAIFLDSTTSPRVAIGYLLCYYWSKVNVWLLPNEVLFWSCYSSVVLPYLFTLTFLWKLYLYNWSSLENDAIIYYQRKQPKVQMFDFKIHLVHI